MKSLEKSRSAHLFRKFILTIEVVLLIYAVAYTVLQAKLASAFLWFGLLVLSPLTRFLERKDYIRSAHFLLISSANFYIFFTSMGLRHQVNAEYFFFPALLLPILLLDTREPGLITAGLGIPVVLWLTVKVSPASVIPSDWLPTTFPYEVAAQFNFIAAYSVTLMFLSIFLNSIRLLNLQIVENQIENQRAIDLERSKSIANAKLASLGEMAAGLAHEINNPLAAIDGNLRLLERGKSDLATHNHYIGSALKGVDRIVKIVSGLRKFSRGTSDQPYVRISLTRLINETFALTMSKSKTCNVPVSTEAIDEVELNGQEVELEQVLINLIHNSIDAVKNLESRWVKVSASLDNDQVSIRVIDSGTGIQQKLIDKIFEPFFTTKPLGQGTGLGLSISRGIILEHGGSLNYIADSKNTCFEIRLPRAA